MPLPRVLLPIGVVAAVVVAMLAVTLRPYKGNVSALFHFDQQMHDTHQAPEGFVVLQMPGYDGMQYYQIARTLDKVVNPAEWGGLRSTGPASYAYQRILLPILAFDLSVIGIPLPIGFLLINVLALFMVAVVMMFGTGRWLYAVALALSPAATIGLHFSLAEPVTLMLLATFVLLYGQKQRIGWVEVMLLSCLVLSREINILFVGFVFAWSLLLKQWKDMLWLLIPMAVFAGWHAVLYAIFGNFPFLTSAAKNSLPFQSLMEIFAGVQGYNRLTASSMAYALLFYLPAVGWLLARFFKGDRSFLPVAGLIFLGIMSVMSWDIWGSMTSIGRVITPAYPLVLVYAARTDTWPARLIAAGCLICGLAIAAGLALTVHPYIVS